MHLMARRTAVLFATLIAGIVATLVWAPAASAGSDESIVTSRGSVSWFNVGDKTLTCDSLKDGLSIEGHFRFVGRVNPSRILHAAGAGNCDNGTWDTYEGADIEIQLCYRKGSQITACSDYQRAEV